MMSVFENRVKRILREGKPAFGLLLGIPHPEVAEMLSLLGYDWLIIDMEHAPIDLERLELMAMAIRSPVVPLARVPSNDPIYVKRVLDTGVMGVMIPHVDDKEAAILAARSARYPPRGIRGVGPRRAARYGLARREYLEKADYEVMVIVQIESWEAVKNAEDILTVDGVDAYFVGPADLSTSMGFRGDWRRPEVLEAIERVAEVGRAHGVPGGTYCPNPRDVKWALGIGLRMLALGSDYRFLVNCAKLRLEEARRMIKCA